MTKLRFFALVVAAAATMTFAACTGVKAPAERPTGTAPLASLWKSPVDLPARDLFYGPWGREYAPSQDAVYTFVELKHTGVNLGMTVVDPQGREWHVKQTAPGGLDLEGPVEVVLSRLLSAVGYHQPPVYYLPSFTLKDDWGTHRELGGRFRLKQDAMKEIANWSWQENPFIGSRPYQGLLVLMIMFNSTDLKNSNNSIYERRKGDSAEREYMVRDLGSALGDLNRQAPTKGNPAMFERDGFIRGVTNGHVDFAYMGPYRRFLENRITPAEVVWATSLLAQLTDRQWQAAFRAGGFEPAAANRFIRKLRQKVAEGQALQRQSTAARAAR